MWYLTRGWFGVVLALGVVLTVFLYSTGNTQAAVISGAAAVLVAAAVFVGIDRRRHASQHR